MKSTKLSFYIEKILLVKDLILLATTFIFNILYNTTYPLRKLTKITKKTSFFDIWGAFEGNTDNLLIVNLKMFLFSYFKDYAKIRNILFFLLRQYFCLFFGKLGLDKCFFQIVQKIGNESWGRKPFMWSQIILEGINLPTTRKIVSRAISLVNKWAVIVAHCCCWYNINDMLIIHVDEKINY